MIVIKLLSNHEDSYLIQLLSPIYILVIILKGHSKKKLILSKRIVKTSIITMKKIETN